MLMDFNATDYDIPLLRYRGKLGTIKTVIKQVFKTRNEPNRRKGYRGVELNWNSDLGAVKKKVENFEIAFDSTSITLFNAFL